MASPVKTATMPPKLPITYKVHMPPHISNKDFEKIWSEIGAQFTPRNDIVSIDLASFNALSESQVQELHLRWVAEFRTSPVIYKSDGCNAVYMASEEILSKMYEVNEDWRRMPVIDAARAIGQEQVPESVKLIRRHEGPPFVPHPHGQLILGQGRFAWNNAYVAPPSPPAPILVSPPVTTSQALTLQRLGAPRIGRPPNSWIIYRSDKHAGVKFANPDKKNSVISSIIAAMWAKETVDVRKRYAALAAIAAVNHQIQFPGYRYKPRLASTIKRRRGFARASAVTKPIETFDESEEVMTQINGSHNMVDNSTQCVGGYDATVYQDEDAALGLVNPTHYDWW